MAQGTLAKNREHLPRSQVESPEYLGNSRWVRRHSGSGTVEAVVRVGCVSPEARSRCIGGFSYESPDLRSVRLPFSIFVPEASNALQKLEGT